MRATTPKYSITNPDSLLNKESFDLSTVILILNNEAVPVRQTHHNVEPRKTPTTKKGISELVCDRRMPEAPNTPRKKTIVMGLDNVRSSVTA